MSDAVTTTVEDGVAVVRLDDGKANALSMSVIGGLHEALEKASAEATALATVHAGTQSGSAGTESASIWAEGRRRTRRSGRR